MTMQRNKGKRDSPRLTLTRAASAFWRCCCSAQLQHRPGSRLGFRVGSWNRRTLKRAFDRSSVRHCRRTESGATAKAGIYTDDWGWYWVAGEPEAQWGWVVYHYGRWVLDPDLGLPPKAQLFVRDAFVADAYVVDSHEPLDGVLEHLASHHIGSALVTKSGRLAGIFTTTDACRIFCQHLRSLFPSPSGEDAA